MSKDSDDCVIVRVSLHGNLQRVLQQTMGKASLRLPPGSTVNDIIRILGIDAVEIGLIAVNDVLSDGLVVVRDGDQVAIFEPIGGG